MTLIEQLSHYLNVSPETLSKLISSILIFLVLWLCGRLGKSLVTRKVDDVKKAYRLRRTIIYTTTILMILLIGRVWIRGFDSITTFLGLVSAGIAVAMHDTIANIAGWLFIIWRKPFKTRDRIQIGDVAGDVIDIRLFQFSLVEIGNWVDADQSTGRILHIPNSKVLREPLANYHHGFRYIWHEIPVLITFESNWKKAKKLLTAIAFEKAEKLSKQAGDQIRAAAKKYLIFYNKLTPIVYTTVKDSGVMLTIRYMVQPRRTRSTEEEIWEAILEMIEENEDINLAYPTTRFYQV
jgi:small-conductance mechanosensitive channel